MQTTTSTKISSENNGINNEQDIDNDDKKQKIYEWDIVWRNIFLIGSIHIAAFYGLYTKYYYIPKWQSFAFNILGATFGGFGVTAGRHRLWSHKCYKAHKYLELFLAMLATTVFEQSIYLWCRDHRLHHKYSDTDADPYNSRRGFFFSHIGWFFVRKHKDVKEKGKTIDLSDLHSNPIVMFEHKHNKLLAFLFTFFLPSFIPWYFWNERPEIAVFYCCFWRLVLVLNITWSVNSFAHIYGWRPYDKNIQPVENDLIALFTAGEGFHNYHHTFPWDYKTAELGSDARNITTCFIDILAYFHLVTDRKSASKDIIEKRLERTGNADLLTPKRNLYYSTVLVIISILMF